MHAIVSSVVVGLIAVAGFVVVGLVIVYYIIRSHRTAARKPALSKQQQEEATKGTLVKENDLGIAEKQCSYSYVSDVS